ncbi:hypothetical protein SAMN06295974_3874 [Plantibacter flavus]|uniref:Uncharacterized protein n=2 Tax=Plantibacter flavus TaxID=150123 RepID=A0A3N2BL29_9MICO|nr:hypothetical protein EDD42_3932 [Plantibacter flavus]SMG49664.1 hypothetical protein SAMN06295974_3874 [Plantibacter flavus]
MFGFVTNEDRERWNKMKAASDEQMEGARNGLTAKGLASQSAAPMIGMAERSINAQMTGEANAQRRAERDGRKERVELTETRTRFFENDAPASSPDREMGY